MSFCRIQGMMKCFCRQSELSEFEFPWGPFPGPMQANRCPTAKESQTVSNTVYPFMVMIVLWYCLLVNAIICCQSFQKNTHEFIQYCIINVISSTLGDDQPNVATKCGNQENKCAMTAQRAPYKMQNPELRSSRNRNFGNNMEALQNAEPGAFFIHEKKVLVENVWPRRI